MGCGVVERRWRRDTLSSNGNFVACHLQFCCQFDHLLGGEGERHVGQDVLEDGWVGESDLGEAWEGEELIVVGEGNG